LEAWYIT